MCLVRRKAGSLLESETKLPVRWFPQGRESGIMQLPSGWKMRHPLQPEAWWALAGRHPPGLAGGHPRQDSWPCPPHSRCRVSASPEHLDRSMSVKDDILLGHKTRKSVEGTFFPGHFYPLGLSSHSFGNLASLVKFPLTQGPPQAVLRGQPFFTESINLGSK